METKTFVFFDLETTGLESGTRITEISLVAASRDHIIDKHNGVTKENIIGEDFLPRVLNKVNLTVYPCRMIHPRASEITGLTNENLEVQRPFDENVFKLIVYFMERLEKPICLVAHNGNKFDFPILQSELLKINKEFSDDLYCVDSLPGFREVLTRSHNREENAICGIKPLNDTNTMTAATLVPKCDWSCEEYDQELDQVTELAEKFTQEDKSLDSDKLDRKIQMEMQRIRAINENTPQRKSRKSATCQPINLPNVRRKILNDQQPRNFELKSIYESTTKRECLNSHRAEADALALLECVTAVGRPILEWMDSKRIPFKSIKKRW